MVNKWSNPGEYERMGNARINSNWVCSHGVCSLDFKWNIELEKSMTPLVSVGIPTYNNPDGLRKVMECILMQTYDNLELIVSDNCSENPDVQNVIQWYALNDYRIKAHRQSVNIGAEANFSFVRDNSTGKYFMWAQDDDWWSQTYIERLVAALEENPDIPVAACPSMYVSKLGGQSEIHYLNNLSVFNAVGNGDLGLACMGIWKTSEVKKYEVKFPPKKVLGIDHIQMATVLMACGKVIIVDSELYKKGYTPGKFQTCFKYEPFYAYNSWWFMMKVLAGSPLIPMRRKVILPLVAITNFVRATAITGVQFVVAMPDNPLKRMVQDRMFGAK